MTREEPGARAVGELGRAVDGEQADQHEGPTRDHEVRIESAPVDREGGGESHRRSPVSSGDAGGLR